ncbi:MAG: hypothetical protein ACREFY_09395, partial [Acetobacteraceae bacterium]
PYFGAYVSETYVRCQKALGLSLDEVVTLARNSLTSAWASQTEIAGQVRRLERYVAEWAGAAQDESGIRSMVYP